MSHLCTYCGNETAGADPCPWCNGSMGVVPEKPKIEPVVIHDVVKRSNPWPAIGAGLLILLVVIALTQQKRSQDRIAAAIRQEPTYVVSNTPMFKTSGPPPKLAKTASISGNLAPEPVKAAVAKTDEADDTADTATDTADEPAATMNRPESIQLSNVQMASQSDGEGHEMSVGTATIYNSSPYEVTNYDLYISASGGNYRLQPFTGTADNPSPLVTKTIAPGARITVPVMTNDMYTVADPAAAKTVSVEATENGVTVSSQVTVD